MSTDLADARYADAGAIVADAFAGFLPAERLSVAEYAAAHRWLSNEGGGYVGRWRHEEAPYLVGPMECLTSPTALTVALVGPGQCGKTAVAENWLLKNVATDPADMLWYMQTDQGIEAYVKGRINPMIDAHEELRRLQGLRPVDDSLHFKRFRGMKIEFLSATPSSLINKAAPRIIADEIDAYPPSLGDVKAMLDVRRQTFGYESMLFALSHPDLATGLDPAKDWNAGIMAIYKDSDRRAWYWPCPHCNGWSSPVPTAARVMTVTYPADAPLDEIEEATRLSCPLCGADIEDKHRKAMNLAAYQSPSGGWVGLGQEIDEDGTVTGQLAASRAAGFWIVGAMSPFIIGGIGGLARARVKAEREFESTGEDQTLRTVVVKQWGLPYVKPRAVGTLDAETLADRAESDLALGKVAQGVRFLVAAIDVQAAHFEVLVRGFGVAAESWIVDRWRVPAEPATDPSCWDRLLEALLTVRYPLADISGRGMALRGIGYDSGGLPGVSAQAFAAWRRLKAARTVRLLGKVDGRPVWSVLPLKGRGTLEAPKLQVVYPDSARKDRRIVHTGTVPLGLFNANSFKDDVAGQLETAKVGPGFVHFPKALRRNALRSPPSADFVMHPEDKPPYLWFEQLVAEQRRPDGRWTREHQGIRNEALDLMAMTSAIAHLHGLAGINWTRPPSWAADWAANDVTIGALPGAATMAPTLPIVSATAPPAAPPKPKRSILDILG